MCKGDAGNQLGSPPLRRRLPGALEAIPNRDAQLQPVFDSGVNDLASPAIEYAQILIQRHLHRAFQRQKRGRPPGEPETERVTAEFHSASRKRPRISQTKLFAFEE